MKLAWKIGGVLVGGGLILLFFLADNFFLSRTLEFSNDEGREEENEVAEEVLEEQKNETLEEQPKVFLDVTREDCEHECSSFEGDQEKKSYCQSVCGFSTKEGETQPAPDNCDEKKDIERDTCIKEEAVAEKNISRCNDIYDANIKKSCQTRVTEELFP